MKEEKEKIEEKIYQDMFERRNNDIVNIKLSFNENYDIYRRRSNGKTVASVVSYFKMDTIADFVSTKKLFSIAKQLGYMWNSKHGIFEICTKGVVVKHKDDEDDQELANRIAHTKAKVKAYETFNKLLSFMYDHEVNNSIRTLEHNVERTNKFLNEEIDALKRCIETGYCKK